jgi:hypothetical protein
MSAIPTYQAATVGFAGSAGQANQFLAPHNATFVYSGAVLTDSRTTGSAVYTNTDGQYISQQFVTTSTQTEISQVWLQVSAVNGSAVTNNIDPLVVSIYADFGGFPTGSALATSSLTETVIYGSSFWVVFLIPLSGMTPSSTYHIITSPAGVSGTHYYVWQRNNQTSGALTSTDNADWNIETYGLMYQVYDQTAFGTVQYIVEDNNSRWTQFGYSAQGLVTSITEYTIDQTGSGNLYSSRTLSHTDELITGIN